MTDTTTEAVETVSTDGATPSIDAGKNDVFSKAAAASLYDAVSANVASIVDAYDDAESAAANGAFEAALRASSKIPFSADVARFWITSRGETTDNEIELAVRQVHEIVRPVSAPSARSELSENLACVVNASSSEMATVARDGDNVKTPLDPSKPLKACKSVPKRTVGDKGSHATANAARMVLEAKVREATDAGASNEKLAHLADCLAAIDNPAKMQTLGRALNAAQVAATKFRGSLFLPMVAQTIVDCVQDHNRNASIGGFLKVGDHFEEASRKASSAVFKLTAASKGADAPAPDAITNAACNAVREFIAEKAEANSAKVIAVPLAERKSNAVSAIFRAARKLAELEIIGGEDDLVTGLGRLLVVFEEVGLADPKDDEDDEKEAAKQERIDAANTAREEKRAARQKEKDDKAAAKKAAKPASKPDAAPSGATQADKLATAKARLAAKSKMAPETNAA